MGLLTTGEVVLLPFPFSDLSQSKLRPVLLLANVRRGDWIACQITSNPHADPDAISISISSFAQGGLRHTSYICAGKLFTAHESLMTNSAGVIKPEPFQQVCDAIVAIIRGSKL